jgi:hypothetical protein
MNTDERIENLRNREAISRSFGVGVRTADTPTIRVIRKIRGEVFGFPITAMTRDHGD